MSMSHWEKKIRRVFKLYDTNQDGVLSEADFQLWSDRLIQASPSMTEEMKQEIRQTRMALWINFINGGVTPAKGTEITPEQFVESMKEKRKDPEMRGQIVSIVKAVFVVFDVNRDGVLQKDEFMKMASLHPNVSTEAAEIVFAAIDKNGDGVLQFNEYLDAIVFFVSDENDTTNPLNYILGKLE